MDPMRMDPTSSPTPLVTVLLVTYNHAGHVGRALESVLVQETDFPFEVLISEDASTDGTRAIVEAAVGAHPGKVRAILSSSNVASNEVVARGLREARGRYLSMLDGDDYWIRSDKLQRQAEHLEAHPGSAAVFHNALVGDGDSVTDRRWTPGDQPSSIGWEEIWQGNPFATCSGMLRLSYVRDMPAWYADLFPVTDWPLYVVAAEHGRLDFVDEPVGVYRVHSGGLYSQLAPAARLDAVERFYRHMIRSAGPRFARAARRGGTRFFLDWAEQYLSAGDLADGWRCLRRGLSLAGLGAASPRGQAVRVAGGLLRRSVGLG